MAQVFICAICDEVLRPNSIDPPLSKFQHVISGDRLERFVANNIDEVRNRLDARVLPSPDLIFRFAYGSVTGE